jgi:hypothetical protein
MSREWVNARLSRKVNVSADRWANWDSIGLKYKNPEHQGYAN